MTTPSEPPRLRLTHIGTATVLIEVGGLRFLTDPALDPAGRRYRFFPGLSSTKTEPPSLPAGGLGAIDAALVSHDHHADNFDEAGRAFACGTARRIFTTVSGARRLGGNAEGLAPWSAAEVVGDDGLRVRVTATPARHGPPGIDLVDAETTGFLLSWEGQRRGPLWISGDTVWFAGIGEVASRAGPIGLAVVHVGDVGFPLTGPLRFTFDGPQAARAAAAVGAHTIVPVHYAGWTHFRAGRAEASAAFEAAGLAGRVRWLVPGQATPLEA